MWNFSTALYVCEIFYFSHYVCTVYMSSLVLRTPCIPQTSHLTSDMTSDLYFFLTFARMKAPSHPRWCRGKWPNGPWLPEQLSRTAFLSQWAVTLSCSEGAKRERLRGALWHFGSNLVLLMLLCQATGDLISQPDDPRCSVVYSYSDLRIQLFSHSYHLGFSFVVFVLFVWGGQTRQDTRWSDRFQNNMA